MVEENQPIKEESAPKPSALEEVKATLAEIKKEREEYAKIRDELNQLRADQLMSGSAGIRQEPVVHKETPKEYAARVMSGDAKPSKDE